ncbi:MAG TPA: alpha/beta hydrolase [Anaerolineales bacterium]|nr:alpha/beta hydrolase [Anaerolineales bacterium]
MNNSDENISVSSARADHIPVIWIMPNKREPTKPLAIWLPGGLETKEDTLPYLKQLATAGFVAASFDPSEHGERSSGESNEQKFVRGMANFPRVLWPIIGQSALDTMHVIDWAIAELGISPPCLVGGISLGGDIAVAAAGIDARIGCVSAIVATPDWRRPGMHVGGQLAPAGQPDRYAQFFYDHINPLTNLAGYAHCPAITFECGADDDHVPPDGALRFQSALQETYGAQPDRLRVNLHPGVAHQSVPAMWQNSLEWFSRHRR